MTEKEYFDTAIEFAGLKDCKDELTPCNTIAIHKNPVYGTTYDSIEKLSKCSYISDLEVKKNKSKNVLIEAIPYLLNRDYINIIFRNGDGPIPLEFVDINDILFIDSNSNILKFPNNKTDLANNSKIENEDRYYFFKSILNKDIKILKDYLNDKYKKRQTNLLYRMICVHNLISYEEFESISNNFGKSAFIYPQYGLNALLENVCFMKAMKGCTYLVNETIEIIECNEEDYKYRIKCDIGEILCKRFINKKFEEKISYVTVIEIDKVILDGNFIIFIESEEIIKIIGLDHRSSVCKSDHQLLYFITKESPVILHECKGIKIPKSSIISEISFKVKFDFKNFF